MLLSNKIDDLVEFNIALIGNYVSFHYDTPPLVNLNFDKKLASFDAQFMDLVILQL